MEGTKRIAAAFTGGAFNHGPAECLEKDFRLVVIGPGDSCRELTDALAARAADLGARVVLMSDTPGPHLSGVVRVEVPVGPVPRDASLFALRASRVQNLLLHEVAARQGHEAGVFRHGSKVTAHE
jgi:fructoselysine-6-P-deglycase FrlB-like protein